MKYTIDLSRKQLSNVVANLYGVISIKRNDGTYENVTLTPLSTTPTPCACCFRSNGEHSETCIYEPQPSYDRAQVLREEWSPKNTLPSLWTIDLQNRIVEYAHDSYDFRNIGIWQPGKKVFAPRRELAEEIVAIREGKWLPHHQDRFFAIRRDKMTVDWDGVWRDIQLEEDDFYIYFPSPEQRDRFIAEHKPKEREPIALHDASGEFAPWFTEEEIRIRVKARDFFDLCPRDKNGHPVYKIEDFEKWRPDIHLPISPEFTLEMLKNYYMNKFSGKSRTKKNRYVGTIPSSRFQQAIKLYADSEGFLKLKE